MARDEVNLAEALARISSSSVRDRTEALDDIKHIIQYNTRTHKFDELKDKNYHVIFEKLFLFVSGERSRYVKGAKGRSNPETTLTKCSEVLRAAVEAGCHRLRIKTVQALLDHILDTLPLAGEVYCRPLASNYLKCLKSILDYHPHVEHLSQDSWSQIVDFCVDGINLLDKGSDAVSFRTPNAFTDRSMRSGTREPPSKEHHTTYLKRDHVETLVVCLRNLTDAPNASILGKSEPVISSVIGFLESSNNAGRFHFDAFTCINSVLKRIVLESSQIMRQAIQRLIPLIKDLWSPKHTSLHDEMLITLIHSQAHVTYMLKSSNYPDLSEDLYNLVEVLFSEYSKRQERDQLQIDHISLKSLGECPGPAVLKTNSFALRSSSTRIEEKWVTVYLIAKFSALLDSSKLGTQQELDNDPPRKRSRNIQNFHEYLNLALGRQSPSRTSALQVLAFMLQECMLKVDEVQLILEKLIPYVSHENNTVASWALIATASLAFQKASISPDTSRLWITIWQLASRSIMTPSSCRTACHVMDLCLKLSLVSYASVAEIVDGMISSIELNGPAFIAESSLALLSTLIKERLSENPRAFAQTSERILHWLFSKWTPSLFGNRSYLMQSAQHYIPRDILCILHACTDQFHQFPSVVPFATLGPIAQAWSEYIEYRPVTDYLLLNDDSSHFLVQRNYLDHDTEKNSTNPNRQSLSMEAKILEYCITEIDRTSSTWKEWVTERPKGISSDMIRTVMMFCVVVASMIITIREPNRSRSENANKLISALVKDLTCFLSRQECEQDKVDASLEVLVTSLPRLGDISYLDLEIFNRAGVTTLAAQLTVALDTRSGMKDSFCIDDTEGFMDVDEEFETQTSRNGNSNSQTDTPRNNLAARSSILALRSSTTAYAYLITYIAKNNESQQGSGTLPKEIIEYLTSLKELNLLSCSQFLKECFTSGLQLQDEDTISLLEYIGFEFLGKYPYERNEVVHNICLDIMSATATGWSTAESGDLKNAGEDTYDWFVNKGLEKGIFSNSVQIGIANLLQRLLKVQPEYMASQSVPSVRTTLFGILQRGDVSVKYHITERLSEIFGLFILARHDDIFNDVHDTLPMARDWSEGIAIRLLLLSRLASGWHTLLRRGVYHIFETAGIVSTSVGHAAYCIRNISQALELDEPQSLFRLFARQLLYTWLETQSLDTIPFSAFGYLSLTDLLRDVQHEVLGQLVMRRKEDQMMNLSHHLEVSVLELLTSSFSQATAYAISWDTCSGGPRNKQTQGSEIYVRDCLEQGGHSYRDLIRKYFPQILGLIISSIDGENQFEKALAKRPAFNRATEIIKTIKSFSNSKNELPPNQQPSFNAKFLLDQIERLCRRLAYDSVEFWNPDIFVRVIRMLISRIQPALGSLHACSMIRKIRIVVSLAGNVALDGYPLQMTIQALRPFLTDNQCAEDTLGIVQYLYTQGKPFLLSHISFVLGTGLSILLSLRAFLTTSQDSTTQESQYVATMNKAQVFHSWFVSYLEEYHNAMSLESVNGQHKRNLKAFKSIIDAAASIRSEGNATSGTAESKLLLELLDDDRSGRRLLNTPSQELAFHLLCQNFQDNTSFRDDIFGQGHNATIFAAQVWRSCHRAGVNDDYLAWAARVLGRTFASSGKIPPKMQRLSRPLNSKTRSSRDPEGSSEVAILTSLVDLLSSDNQSEVGLAENTLRLILSRFEDSQESVDLEQVCPAHILTALSSEYHNTAESQLPTTSEPLRDSAVPKDPKSVTAWSRDLAVSLVQANMNQPLLGALPQILACVNGLAEQLFPLVLHLILREERDGQQNVRQAMSASFQAWFNRTDMDSVPYIRILLDAIIYLRSQPIPREVTRAERDHWLNLNYSEVAEAAIRCGMHSTALLFAETFITQPVQSSRRGSTSPSVKLPLDLQLAIYKNVDDPDAFYGVEQSASLTNLLERFDHEADGIKSLLFRGAQMDSGMRLSNTVSPGDSAGILHSLLRLNLNSVTHSLVSSSHLGDVGTISVNNMLQTARKLEQWDIRAPETNVTESAIIFRAFQGIKNSSNLNDIRKSLAKGFLQTIKGASPRELQLTSQEPFRTLAILSEIDDVTSSRNSEQLQEAWRTLQSRNEWMRSGHLDAIRPMLSCRETLLSLLSGNDKLQADMHTSPRDIKQLEVNALLDTSKICRKHGALQESLVSATYLTNIVAPCKTIGLEVDFPVRYEVAGVLWDQGEMTSSIKMLQDLASTSSSNSKTQENLANAVLFSTLGIRVAEARLEKPDEIIRQYLMPAIKSLRGNQEGREAGQVFHEFAAFCDQQLQNTDLTDELVRIQRLMEHKEAEAQEYERLSKGAKTTRERDHYRSAARRSKKWYDIDAQEYRRLRASREAFLQQSLENYLLSLHASEEYNNDVLRVFSLWLEFSEASLANDAVKKHISVVPSRKFALLMNQLSSRLQAEKTKFQTLLSDLVLRICIEHPYHGMHQIFAGAMPLVTKDESAKSRNTAAKEIAKSLKSEEKARRYWSVICESNTYYHDLASWKDENSRTAREQLLEKNPIGKKLIAKVPGLKIPPATLNIDARPSCDYSDIPRITSFKSKMSIANGLSAPKVVTAVGSDGLQYKQLFKSGNDDLRQDAIMEQVFEQVSKLLKSHAETRLRELHIRTYKVLPLSGRSGIIEFVQNTIPLHNFLMRAHEKYYPKDYKADQCRNLIHSAVSESTETRVKKFRNIMDNFHPIGRFFFLERFEDPVEWFERRLAYTRSTAAISILGHVLGLGDRHCHNILLDEKSGEVVHIDLGVAFEAGRVLPVPEVVPFRLTRDLVDAMGYTKTEGAFRRCCEFTMKTLRVERESIMTLLNVLRYDPLVNWTISPLKAKRMQDAQEESRMNPLLDDIPDNSSKKKEDEAGEAVRALSVVEKKLAKGLSAAATVNELIQQATDERNLAVLYCGWAAYA